MNTTPWNIPLETRKKDVLVSLKSGKKVALMLYPRVDQASSFRYRSYNIYQATKESKKWQLVYFFMEEIAAVMELLPKCHLLIFGRIDKWSRELDDLKILANANNVKVVFDLDDCVCGQKNIKTMFNVVSPDTIDQEYWINTSAQFELVSLLADGFIVTNDYLGKVLSDSHDDKPYQVIPNSLNAEQITYSTKFANKNLRHKDVFTIGYFSGSHTHATDFEVVYPELIQLLSDHHNFRLRIVGMLQLPKSAGQFIKRGQIEYVGMVDFLTLEKLMSEVDINIAPLADNVFANCKSELKFFESALVKTPTIASPTYAFSHSIQNGKTGFLCQPGEWADTILNLYQNPDFAKTITENAYKYALDNYSPTAILSQVEKVYDYYGK